MFERILLSEYQSNDVENASFHSQYDVQSELDIITRQQTLSAKVKVLWRRGVIL